MRTIVVGTDAWAAADRRGRGRGTQLARERGAELLVLYVPSGGRSTEAVVDPDGRGRSVRGYLDGLLAARFPGRDRRRTRVERAVDRRRADLC